MDIMKVATSQRQLEFTRRMARAKDEHPDWWRQVQTIPPGQPAPYDPRCGLTEVEYEEFLALTTSMNVVKAGEAMLEVRSGGENIFVFDGGAELPQWTGFEVNYQSNLVRTPLGEAKKCIRVEVTESVFGEWSGTEWTLERGESGQQKPVIATFALGTLSSSGRAVMFYRERELGRGGKTTVLQILTFEDPRR
ncbi:MAG: hypothetical protein SFU86_06950 [Pirellulaceae bacterium]|nr:hypothetical protein [Pirellulaceae bacterium]